jgi:hypothetical protein
MEDAQRKMRDAAYKEAAAGGVAWGKPPFIIVVHVLDGDTQPRERTGGCAADWGRQVVGNKERARTRT